MHRYVRCSVSERCPHQSGDDIGHCVGRGLTRGPERSELDDGSQCFGGLDGGRDMPTWQAFDKRFDGEL